MNHGEADASARSATGAAAAHLQALASAFAFLTRLPVPKPSLQPDALARSLVWFPVVGLVLGLIQALAGHAVSSLLSPGLAAVSVVAIAALLTGALHLDGLADVFDGLGGGRGDPSRALEIMRDSRIGAFGALALVLAVSAKIAALDALLAAGTLGPLLLAPVAARAAAVFAIVRFPYARSAGLGKAFHQHGRAHHVAFAFVLASLIAWSLGAHLLLLGAGTCLVAALFCLWLSRRLGGLTGDAYGAVIELSELGCLVAASAM